MQELLEKLLKQRFLTFFQKCRILYLKQIKSKSFYRYPISIIAWADRGKSSGWGEKRKYEKSEKEALFLISFYAEVS